jgi:RNA recognition motif-containing protein
VEKEAEEAEELSKVVYMKNLNFETQEAALYEIFEKIAPIKYAKIVKSKEGKSMGFGFVEYDSN